MIGKISGIVDYKSTDHVLIDVRGVGYIVYVSERTRAMIPNKGEAVALYTEQVVRQDLIQLFGFPTLIEKEWHRLLTSVQGVGSKAAMAIMGALGPDGVSRAIAIGDWGAVKAAQGVGPKLAQRVVNELKDKAPTVMAMGGDAHDALEADVIDDADIPAPTPKPKKSAKSSKAATSAAAQADALSALGNLGYGPSEAASAVATAAGDHDGADTSTLIREALKLLAPKG